MKTAQEVMDLARLHGEWSVGEAELSGGENNKLFELCKDSDEFESYLEPGLVVVEFK